MKKWPVFVGDFKVGNFEGWIAIATLNTPWEDMQELLGIEGVAIIGSVKTENLGVEKIVANVISNPNIRVLVLCGRESKGHYPGDALICLLKNGVDEEGRIIDARGAIPYLENLSRTHVEHFRKQIVEIMDLREIEDVEIIKKELEKLREREVQPYEGGAIYVEIEEKKGGGLQHFEGDVVFINEAAQIDTSTFKVELVNQQG